MDGFIGQKKSLGSFIHYLFISTAYFYCVLTRLGYKSEQVRSNLMIEFTVYLVQIEDSRYAKMSTVSPGECN